MLSHPNRIASAISNIRPGVRSTRGLLFAGGAALVLTAFGTHPGSPSVEGAPEVAVMSTSGVPSAPAVIRGTGCWATGDLVGEGNPADVAAALCGQK
jgi:hypothetical protein